MKLNIISFNIRCCDDPNGYAISERAPRLSNVTSLYDADIIGFQEVTWMHYGYLKNITENTCDNFNIPAIINKNKINYIFNDTKHIIHINNNEIILLRENKDMKNILTFSKNRSILSEYIIKSNNIQVDILVETIDLLC